VVARAFLAVPEFVSVSEALEAINRRGARVSLATVSKVCARLDEDLVIERKRDKARGGVRLRLLQPDKLLDLLATNYAGPDVTGSLTGKTPLSPEELRNELKRWQEANRRARGGDRGRVRHGIRRHGPRAGAAVLYCSDLAGLRSFLGERLRETERFPNVTLLETRDDFVYFDARPGLVASPVQTYLELSAGDKRDRETAEQVRRAVLAPLQNPRNGSPDGDPAGLPA